MTRVKVTMVPNVGEEVYITTVQGFEDVTVGPYRVTQVDDPIPPNPNHYVHVTINGASMRFPSSVVHRYDPLARRRRAANNGNPQEGLRPGHRTFEFS